MSAKDVLIQPIYGCRYREYIELVDSNGAPIALASGDTELIKDGAAAVDATNEMAEITTGYCSVDLTYAEMSYQSVIVIPKSASALTRIIKLFPQRLPVLRSGTAQAGAAGSITLDAGASAKDGAYVGCWVRASNNTPAGIQGQLRKISGYTGSTKVATVVPDWDNNPTSSTTFEVLIPSDMSISTLLSTAAETATAVQERNVVGTTSLEEAIRLILARLVGKVSGGGTATISFRDVADTKNRIVMTVDAAGDRSTVVLDAS
jgi:hypothetical protein